MTSFLIDKEPAIIYYLDGRGGGGGWGNRDFWPKTVTLAFAPKSSHAQIFFKLVRQKGNDIPLPKREKKEQQQQKKKWGSSTSFWREHAPKNTLNLKNRASLAGRATVSVSPKILQLDLQMKFSLPNIVQVDLLSEFSQLVRFLKEQVRI